MTVGSRVNQVKITIPSDPKELSIVRTAAGTFAERHGLGAEPAGRIALAVDEALANVIKHGYQGQAGQEIVVTMEHTESEGQGCLKFVVRDFGRQVDPEMIKGRDLDDVRPGGLGVHIIKTVMDRVEYLRAAGGGMELVMLKYLKDTKG